jgi:hypothetical protein
MPFEVGQKVRVMRTALKGNTGTVIEVRKLSGDDWYTVGGQVADHPDELWNVNSRAILPPRGAIFASKPYPL